MFKKFGNLVIIDYMAMIAKNVVAKVFAWPLYYIFTDKFYCTVREDKNMTLFSMFTYNSFQSPVQMGVVTQFLQFTFNKS